MEEVRDMRVVMVLRHDGTDLQPWNLWRLAWTCWWRMFVLGALLGFIAGLASRIWTTTSPEVSYLLFF